MEYDVIYLADNEWGNNTMLQVAMDYFAANPGVEFVLVREHGGWYLGHRRDESIWATANDLAVLKPGPAPTGFSGKVTRRQGTCCPIPQAGHADTCRERAAYLADYPLS